MREDHRRVATTLGWAGVWVLFVVFHALFFTNRLEGLLWVTLVSVGPIWLLTALGGIVEIRRIWGHFQSAGEGGDG